ncbi:LLM class flavin-dependent oxidoreductase, partial [Frankia sp. AvcI1]
MAEYNVRSDPDAGWLDPDNVATFARTLEEVGFGALAFTDHPAPSAKWLAAGGHETFDPFAALTYCAAVTRRIRLMTHLAVVPYRNPLLQARSMTTVDVLSGGRAIFALG